MSNMQYHNIQQWYYKGIVNPYIEENLCKTRSDFNGRLASYETILKNSFSEDCMFLISSSLGEIGNNSFDHNIGFWQDTPGCLFVRENNFALICDRGRGIKQSLSPVYSLTSDDKDYLTIAFNKVITGRAPEKRGNGLKYVKKNILNCKLGLVCVSEKETIVLGKQPDQFATELLTSNQANNGVLTYIYW